MRYAAHERTALAAQVLRVVPIRVAPEPFAAAERRAAEIALPPLPDGPRFPDADVLVITIDALRADHVGVCGLQAPDHARTSTSWRRRACASPAPTRRRRTRRTRSASMMTGKYFPTLARLAPGEYHDPIAAVLRTYGWRTAAFYPPAVFYVDAPKMKAYAARNFDFEYVKFEYLDAEKRVDQVLAYYREVKPKKAFVWVHLFEPHEPYVTHEGFGFGAGDVERYDSEIAYTDAAVGRLVAAVRAAATGDGGGHHRRPRRGVRRARRPLPRLDAVRRAAARAARHLDPGREPAGRRRAGGAHRRHADGAQPARHPGPGAHARHRSRPLAGAAARRPPRACRRRSPRSRTNG